MRGRKIKNREEQIEDGAEIIWERREEGREKLLCLQGIQKDGLEEKAQLGELYTDAMKNRE